MPKLNGRMHLIHPNSNGAEDQISNGAADYYDRRRQHNAVVKHEAARRAGYLNLHEADFSSAQTKAAVEELLTLLKHGRTSRTQVEAEQRADQDRLTGWQVVTPSPGSEGESKLAALKYRMGVRAKALELYHGFEMTGFLSSARPGQMTDAKRPRKPWRRGVAQDSPIY